MLYDLRKLPRNKVLVSPSLLAADFGNLSSQVSQVAKAGADMLHLDIMDGALVPNISFGVPVVKSLRAGGGLLFDAHLMIEHPQKYAVPFAVAGADHITFHIECADDPQSTIAAIREAGCTVGISLKPATPAEALFPYLELIDLVLVMSVEPGFGGQSFMADQLQKVTEFKREILRRNLPVQLEIDGGIDENTVEIAAKAGANLMVAGTAVFRHPEGMATAIAKLHKATCVLDKDL